MRPLLLFLCLLYLSGWVECQECGQGHFRNDEGVCQPCLLGTYKNNEGDNACTQCPLFHTTEAVGTSNPDFCLCDVDRVGPGCSVECATGSSKAVGNFRCRCILGYGEMSDDDRGYGEECDLCPKGTTAYTDLPGYCGSCNYGFTTDGVGNIGEESCGCAPSTYSVDNEEIEGSPTAFECVQCLDNYNSPFGSNSSTDCVCDYGSFVSDGASAEEPLCDEMIQLMNKATCALLTGSVLKCWGQSPMYEDFVLRGDKPGDMSSLPNADLGLGRTVVSFSANLYHLCAILDNQELMCVGWNYEGTLGNGNNKDVGFDVDTMGAFLVPVNLPSSTHPIQVSCGGSHTCVILSDASVRCWGFSYNGCLGGENYNHKGSSPAHMGDALVAVKLGTGRTAKQLTTTEWNTCALLDDDTVKCWGLPDYGVLGFKVSGYDVVGGGRNTMGDNLRPIELGLPEAVTVRALKGGTYFSCVHLSDSNVKCWGQNQHGQLGQGDTKNRGELSSDMGAGLQNLDFGPGVTVKTMSLGRHHACAVLNDFAGVVCWGKGQSGQLGYGDVSDYGKTSRVLSQRVLMAQYDVIKSIHCGPSTTCITLVNGKMKCWGENYGRLGIDTTASVGKEPSQMGDALVAVKLDESVIPCSSGGDDNPGLPSCEECPATTNTTSFGATSIGRCSCAAGYAIDESQGANDDSDDIAAVCSPCADGSFKPETSNTMCTSCPEFSTTSGVGSMMCICDQGFVSQLTFKLEITTRDDICISGDSIRCPADMWKDSYNQCNDCPEYSTSLEGSSDLNSCKCFAGYDGTTEPGTCKPCSPGYYKDIQGNSLCSECATGSFTNGGYGSVACLCEVGYSTQGGDTCGECLANSYKDFIGPNECIQCKAHSLSGAGSTDRSDCLCLAGYGTPQSADICDACDANSYKADPGNEPCTACTSNSDSGAAGGVTCECVAGFTGPDNGPCVRCEPGTYKGNTGSEACTACAGNSTSNAGSTSIGNCVCDKGYYGLQSSACKPCPKGSYQDTVGSSQCKQCDSTRVAPAASTDVTDCECRPGYTPGTEGEVCSMCEAGKFKSTAGSAACQECPSNSESSTASVICSCSPGYTGVDGGPCLPCEPGFFKKGAGSNECIACPDNSESPGGSSTCQCSAGSSGADDGPCQNCTAGSYKSTIGTSNCVSCFLNAMSLSGSKSIDACLCNAGYEQRDYQCDACIAGYQKELWGTDSCTPCAAETFSSEAAMECSACTFSSSSTEASAICQCDAGYSSQLNGSLCHACLGDTYKSTTGNSQCEICNPQTGFAVVEGTAYYGCGRVVSVGSFSSSCAIVSFPNEKDQVKCWGGYGPLVGSTGYTGDAMSEMGAGRPTVSLGTHRFVLTVSVGMTHACVVLDNRKVKCWGRNNLANLGYGDTRDRGMNQNEMGDSLPYVDLGTGFDAVSVCAIGKKQDEAHSCALSERGEIKCWGQSYTLHEPGIYSTRLTKVGQTPAEMGDNLRTINDVTNEHVLQMSCGVYGICGILDDGTVSCQSKLSFRPTGMSNAIGLGNSEAVQISVGDFVCALFRQGSVVCQNRGNPYEIMQLGTGRFATQVSVGNMHACAMLENESVKCWGTNWIGELGYGDTKARGSGEANTMGDNLPELDFPSGLFPVAIYAGSVSCVLLNDNRLRCWGWGIYGRLGHGMYYRPFTADDAWFEMGDAMRETPLGLGVGLNCTAPQQPSHAVPFSDTDMANAYILDRKCTYGCGRVVSVGPSENSCALVAGGVLKQQVKCWGDGNAMLGIGDNRIRGWDPATMGDSLPMVFLGTDRFVLGISAAHKHACAVLDNKKVKCWGLNENANLGYGDTLNRGDALTQMGDSLPYVDLGTGFEAVEVCANGGKFDNRYSCALSTQGEIKCWGQNSALSYTDRSRPSPTKHGQTPAEMGDGLAKINNFIDGRALQLACGDHIVCALLEGGIVKCQRDRTAFKSINMNSVAGLSDNRVVKLSIGGCYCALFRQGEVACWGGNVRGHLGHATSTLYSEFPTEIVKLGTGRSVKQLSVGNTHTCVLLDNNSVKCWGRNDVGVLGYGDDIDRGELPSSMGDNLPALNLSSSLTTIAVYANAISCVLLSDNELRCWGNGFNGMLGHGVEYDMFSDTGDYSEMGDGMRKVLLGRKVGMDCKATENPPHAVVEHYADTSNACFGGGQKTCTCLAGNFQDESEQCNPCRVGTFKALPGSDAETACILCRQNTYASAPGQSACSGCPRYSSSEEGSDDIADCMCLKGFTDSSNDHTCTACAQKTYKNETGPGVCSPCPEGTSSAVASVELTSCKCMKGYFTNEIVSGVVCAQTPQGTYKDTTGTGPYTECGPGKTSLLASISVEACECLDGFEGVECTACARGKYKLDKGSGNCSECAPNTYKNLEGAGPCSPCHTKTSSPPGSTHVEDCVCLPGYYAQSDSRTCVACARNTFKLTSGNQACETCAENTYKFATGPGNCTESTCDAGYTSTADGACVACKLGHFKPDRGWHECSRCPEGQWTNQEASTVASECVSTCGPGSVVADNPLAITVTFDETRCGIDGSLESFAKNGLLVNQGTTCEWEIVGDNISISFDGFTLGQDEQVYITGVGVSYSFGPTQPPTQSSTSRTILVAPQKRVSIYYKRQSGGSSNSVEFAYSTGTLGECLQCEENTYEEDGSNECLSCPSGSASVSGSDSRSDCACGRGESAADGSDACTPCAANTFKHLIGSQPCSPCDASMDCSARSSYTCNAGYEKVDGDDYGCSECPYGEFKSSSESPQCEACPDKGYGSRTTTSCTVCPSTTYNDDSDTACKTCPEGTASDSEGLRSATECDECQAGKFSTGNQHECYDCKNEDSPNTAYDWSAPRSAKCSCEPGSGMYDEHAQVCERCPEHFYKRQLSDDVCTECPANSVGVSNRQTCICNAGYEAVDPNPDTENLECTPCIDETYRHNTTDTTCRQCESNTEFINSQIGCACAANFIGGRQTRSFKEDGSISSRTYTFPPCSQCPEHSSSSLNQVREFCLCLPGYEPVKQDGTFCNEMESDCTCTPCKVDTYKSANDNTQCVQCGEGQAAGLGATQFECIPGYYYRSGECRLCRTGSYSDTLGRESCKLCPLHSENGVSGGAGGSTTREDCACSWGYTPSMDGLQCDACEVGSYKSVMGTAQCSACKGRNYSTAEASISCDFCLDQPGFVLTPKEATQDGSDTGPNVDCLCQAGFEQDETLVTCGFDEYTYGPSSTCGCAQGATLQPGDRLQITNIGADYNHIVKDCWWRIQGPQISLEFIIGDLNLETVEVDVCSVPSCEDRTNIATYNDWLIPTPTTYTTQLAYMYVRYFVLRSLQAPDRFVVATWDKGLVCTMCEAGTYKGPLGRGDCVQCGQNMNSLPGSSVCHCKEGYTRIADGSCEPCAAATYKNFMGDEACMVCPTHTSSPVASISLQQCTCIVESEATENGVACVLCEEGFIKHYTGIGSCEECPQRSTLQGASGGETCICDPGTKGDGTSDCEQCEQGVWCASGDQYVCPDHATSPRMSDEVTDCRCRPGYWGNDGSTCQLCDAGSYCSGGNSRFFCPAYSRSPRGSSSLQNCTCMGGYEGSAETSCVECPENTFCSSGSLSHCPSYSASQGGSNEVSDCVCQAGYYGENGGNCTICPVGSYCPGGNVVNPCGANKITAEGSTSEEQCLCKSRWYTPPGESECVLCEEGTWCTSGERYVCAHGRVSPPGSDSIDACKCRNSTYEDSGSPNQHCASCLEGYYCTGGGIFECAIEMVAYYSPPNSSLADACTCNLGYAHGESNTCVMCAAASYKDSYGTQPCTICPAGNYTVDYRGNGVGTKGQVASASCVSCPLHRTSAIGAIGVSACVCSPGYTETNGICVQCAVGRYKPSSGNSACLECPSGTSSEAASTSIGHCSCKPGYSAIADGVECTACPENHYKAESGPGQCSACASTTGSYAGSTSCNCAEGFTRTPGGNTCSLCPEATYKDWIGDGACGQCDSTRISPIGSTSANACKCKYFYQDCDDARECDINTQCSLESNSKCFQCSPGQFITNDVECGRCYQCPGASISNTGNGSSSCVCAAGFVRHRFGHCIMCPHHTYKDSNRDGPCTQCPSHSSYPYNGAVTVEKCKCDEGYWGTHRTLKNGDTPKFYYERGCYLVQAGYYQGMIQYEGGAYEGGFTLFAPCPANTNASAGSPSIDNCTCIEGYTASESGVACTACATSTYKNFTGNLPCSLCPAGTNSSLASLSLAECSCLPGYSGIEDGVVCEACELGYKGFPGPGTCTDCPSFTSSNAGIVIEDCMCLPGYSSDFNGVACIACPQNTYKDTRGIGTCQACPANSESLAGSARCQCSAGYTSGAGGVCVPCEENTFKASAGDQNCSLCAENTISEEGSISEDQCICMEGYTAPANGVACTPCKPGTYKNETGPSPCSQCPRGTTSAPATIEQDDCGCMLGFIKKIDSIACFACAVGTFRSDAYTCTNCPAGTTSEEASGGIMSCKCMQGYSGDSNGTVCTACPVDTYNSIEGPGECSACPSNTLALLATTDIDNCLCLRGYNASDPGTECDPCAADFFKNKTGVGDCSECAAGTSSPPAAPQMRSCQCRAGFSGVSDGTECPPCVVGTYKEFSGPGECNDCTPNSESESGSTECHCSPGYTLSSSGLTCEACGIGTYKNIKGSQACIVCPTGTSTNETSRTSLEHCGCNPGSMSVIDGPPHECELCAVGKFKNTVGPEECVYCPETGYAYYTGAIECKPCNANSRSNWELWFYRGRGCTCNLGYTQLYMSSPKPGCTAIPAGYFADPGTREEMLQCPSGTSSPPASQTRSDCRCMPGYTGIADGFDCDACDVGYYKSVPGVGVCTICPPTTTTHGSATSTLQGCLCEAGYTAQSNGIQCSACGEGTYKGTLGTGACTQCVGSPDITRSAVATSSIVDCACKAGYSDEYQVQCGGDCGCELGLKPGEIISHNMQSPWSKYRRYQDCWWIISGSKPSITFWNFILSIGYGDDKDRLTIDSCSDAECSDPQRLHTLRNLDADPRYSPVTTYNVGTAKHMRVHFISDEKYIKPGFIASWSAGEFEECSKCPPGYYKDNNNPVECSACPLGGTSLWGATHRDQCFCGKGYSDAVTPGECIACSPASYKDTEGSAQCTACPSGTMTDGAAVASRLCVCKPGYNGTEDAAVCDACAVGSFKSEKGIGQCTSCTRGSTTNRIAATNQEECQCEPGSFWLGYEFTEFFVPSSDCQFCRPGFYKPTIGQELCTPCPSMTTSSWSSKAISDCVCSDNTVYDETLQECRVCREGTYVDYLDGNPLCVLCPEGNTSPEDSRSKEACVCDKGFTPHRDSDLREEGICEKCAAGTTKWNTGNNACLACRNGATSISGSFLFGNCFCSTGYSQASQFAPCEECGANTYKDFGGIGSCAQCPDDSVSLNKSHSVDQCMCNAGYEKTSDDMYCVACEEGTYSNSATSSRCVPCFPNSISLQASESIQSCICIPGYDMAPGGGKCDACMRNYFRNETMPFCASCEEGKFSPTGSTSCSCAIDLFDV